MAMGAVAGLATAASGQAFADEVIAPAFVSTTSFTITIMAHGPGTHIAGGAFAISGSDRQGLITDMTWTPASWSVINTDGGHTGGASYDPVVFGQFILPDFGFPPDPGSALPALVGYFTVQIDEIRYGRMEFQLSDGGGDFALEVFDDTDGSFTRDDGTIVYGTATLIIFPAPSSLGVLTLAGLAMRRRRRV